MRTSIGYTGTHSDGPRVPISIGAGIRGWATIASLGKLWGAVSHAILAIAQQRGWGYGSHNELIQAARRISEEQGDSTIYDKFRETRRLHANYYHGFLEDHELDELRPIAHDFIRRVLALVA